jgi:hypothetical protein
MTGNATPRTVVLSSWDRAVVVATVLAYRSAMGERPHATAADKASREAFVAAGGDPALAGRDVPRIIAAAISHDSTWFWRPARERIARKEHEWKARGIWPPPNDSRGGPE